MIIKIVLLSIVIMTIVIAGFGVKIFFKKGGKFPSSHVGNNEALKEKGVYCATTQDKLERLNVIKSRQYNQKTILDKEHDSL